jgi:glycosyltransferase involved in cell wall biosynthesis
MNGSPATCPRGDAPSICFIHTSPAMVHLLTGTGPDAMGGAELQMYLLGRELAGRGWAVSFLVGDYGQGAALITDEGLRVEPGYETGRRGALFGTARALNRFWQALASVDADVYVTRGLTGQTGVVAAFARSRGRHSLFWFGKNADATYAVPRLSGLPFAERVPAWYGMRHADAIVCQSRQQLGLLREHVGREGVLIRNVAPWHGWECSRGTGGPVLWVGSIQPKKRPEMILQIAAQLPEVQFVMAGGKMRGHASLYERTLLQAADLPNVQFLGFVPHSEIGRHFLEADMLISTSDGELEGFPNVFLQAWCVGLPVVASCDPDGIIARHGLGYVHQTTPGLVRAISAVRTDRQLHRGMAARAREYVEEHHSPDRVGRDLDHLLRDLLEAGPPAVGTPGERVHP